MVHFDLKKGVWWYQNFFIENVESLGVYYISVQLFSLSAYLFLSACLESPSNIITMAGRGSEPSGPDWNAATSSSSGSKLFIFMSILDGNKDYVAQVWRKTGFFCWINFRFTPAFDLTKRLKQIKLTFSIHTCATISELPSNFSIMLQSFESGSGSDYARFNKNRVRKNQIRIQMGIIIFLLFF